MRRSKKRYDILKRASDSVIAGAGLALLSPVIGVTALLVRTKLGSPIIFKQARPGLDGKIFTLYKFRTMLDVNEAQGLVDDADRLTSFGQKLRATSLDELPSLVNVLKGDMSLVGPRPLLVEYLALYTDLQARRHEVRPGITGLAQVRGRNDLSWDEKFEFDTEYVDKRSLGLDFRILIETVLTVLTSRGISQEGHATMPKFGEETTP